MLWLAFVAIACPQVPEKEPNTKPAAPIALEDPPVAQTRTQLNLLGQTDNKSGESRRNENVQFNLVDNNAQKELNQRIGVTASFVQEFSPDRNYFGAEFGPTSPWSVLQAPSFKDSWHGNLNWTHLNSLTSARAFFQVGGVQPARDNNFAAALSGKLWRGASLTWDGSLQALRGVVNGNILAPLPSERTPLATEPRLRAIVASILDSYPNIPPNRPDIDPRMVNLNAPQTIDNRNTSSRLDQRLGTRDQLSFSYNWITQNVQAFQLVRGQNPDTTTRAHKAGLAWNRTISPSTVFSAAYRFDRAGTVIGPEAAAVPYAVYPSTALTPINANSTIPINRAQNAFKTALQLRRSAGRHNWSLGAQFNRHQLNGSDSDSHIAALSFNNTATADAITNVRQGTPITFFQGIGYLHRGFRNWDNWFYFTDNWRASAKLTVNFGIGYRPNTRPVEVNNLNQLPYANDNNNFGPFLGLGYRLAPGWGVLRAGYGFHYGEIFPATFQQIRFNQPLNSKLVIQQPNLADPFRGLDLTQLSTTRAVQYAYSPDLVSPYSQLYNFTWELQPLSQLRWQIGYTGSRSQKLLYHHYSNRGHARPGLPITVANIDERRADPTKSDIRSVENMSRGFYDAFKTTGTVPRWRGLQLEASYWFSKAIDLGADYTSTAHDLDSFRGRSQYEFEAHSELRGRSRFDQPHAFLLRGDYSAPRFRRSWLGRWGLFAVALSKSGTPFQVTAGSDAPGYGNVDGVSMDRPNVLDPSVLGRAITHPDLSRQLLPRSAFEFITPGTIRGNLGRNTFRRGPVRNMNAGVSIDWPLAKERTLAFRVESNNLSNSPQFAEPGFALTDPNFGVITNTLNDGRSFRFSLRLSY
jgi:hypothetical protein